MIFESIILILLYLKIKKLNFKNLYNFSYNKSYIAYLGIFLFLIALFFTNNYYGEISEFLFSNFYYFHILSLILITISVILNIDTKGFSLIALGMFFNILPIVSNGYMPVYFKAAMLTRNETLINKLLEGRSLTHKLVIDSNFFYLSDIIPIPKPYFYSRVISVGDIIISIGLFIAIYSICKRKN